MCVHIQWIFIALGFQGCGVEASDHSTVDPSSQDAEHRPYRPGEQFNGTPIAGWFILENPPSKLPSGNLT